MTALALGRSDRRFHIAVLVAVALLYVVIRVVIAPATGPLRAHGTDLLAGVALPSLFALIAPPGEWASWVRSLGGKLALVGAAILVWEGLVPLLYRSTPDWLDVLAYLSGALVQHALARLKRADARHRPPAAARPKA